MLLYSTQYCYYTTYSTVIIQHTVLLLYNIQYTVLLLYSTQYCYYTTYSTVIIQHTVLLLYNIQYTVLLLYSTQYCYYTAYSTVIIQHTVLLLYSIQYYYYTAYNTVIIQHTVLLLYSCINWSHNCRTKYWWYLSRVSRQPPFLWCLGETSHWLRQGQHCHSDKDKFLL